MQLLRPPADDLRGFRTGGVVDHRHPFLNDTRFFSGDGCHRIAQIFRVVEADGGNHRHQRMGHGVRGIQPSAKPRLQHQVLHACPLKKLHADEEKQLEIGRMGIALLLHLLDAVHHRMEGLQKFFVADVLFIHHEALVDLHQMGRGEKSRPLSPRLQHRSQKGADRAFSVRARHMENLHLLLGIAQSFQKSPGMIQSIFFRKFRRLVDISHRFLICHAVSPVPSCTSVFSPSVLCPSVFCPSVSGSSAPRSS